jgi:tRNA pseudouridine38-40 synthase
MRTLKLTVAYDGTRYAGWQVQRNSDKRQATSNKQKQKPTIQGTLERVLTQILQEAVRAIGSGRTDAGVHALAQVAHIRVRNPMPCERLRHSLNQLLPADIAVMTIDAVPDSFHARFDASTKQYRYRVFTGPVVPPFLRPYVHHVPRPLGLAAMRREISALVGRHDFRAFARAAPTNGSTRRTIRAVRLLKRGDELHFEVQGDGFLHTMVRSMMGTLLDVGRGRLPAGTMARMLRTGDRRLAGTTAPAKGLTLVEVRYGVRHHLREFSRKRCLTP